MKILFIGDIVGRPGRNTIKEVLPALKKEHQLDLVIANGENLAHGRGFTPDTVEEMIKAGIDFFTSGNHVWDVKHHLGKLDDKGFPMIRPANFSEDCFGRGYQIVETSMMQKVLLINLIGRVFMKQHVDCPFRAFDKILKETAHENIQAIFVDFHAETTSEKTAFANYADGRSSVVVGTHTHVPTADCRLLEKGTAYVSDVGMTGCIDSIIGMEKQAVIKNFLTQMPVSFEVAEAGRRSFNSVLVDIDESTRKANSIERLDVLLS